jgi:uncharacterized membrane protein HdeD (DUF308 family)
MFTHAITTDHAKITHQESVREKWGWFLALGVGLWLLGIIAMVAPLGASVAVALFAGSLLLVSGLFQAVHAFKFRKWGDFIGEILLSLIGIGAGLFMVLNPLMGVSALALVLGGYLVVDGISKIYIGFRWRPLPGWGWGIFSGLVSMLLGFLVFSRWPIGSLWILGLLLGINFIFMGTSFAMLGFTLRRLRTS